VASPTPVSQRNTYDQSVTTAHGRAAVTTHPRFWTGPMVADFSVDGVLSAEEFYYTQFGGEHPLVESLTLKFRLFGGPPRETVVTRKHWFPEDPTLAFEAHVRVAFEMLDPVYSAVITFGGIEQTFGVEAEPLRIIQKGSANVGGASVGLIYMDSGGVIEDSGSARANDQLPHHYICRWNPGATQVPGDEILTVLYDGVIQHETSALGFAVQPRYIALSMIQSTRELVDSTGTPGVPSFPMVVYELDVQEYLGGGYEADTQPSWTRPDLGNDIDTAADRERFVMGGETWAKLPIDAISSVSVTSGRDALSDEITIELKPRDPEDLDPVSVAGLNRFADMRWKGRTLVFDTRIEAERFGSGPPDFGSGVTVDQFTTWKRQICAVIEDVVQTHDGIVLTGRDRPSMRLDTFISRAYLNVEPDGSALGEVEGVNIGYLLEDIFEDLVDISDAVAGGLQGATSTVLQLPEVLPQALTSGGESLLPVFAEWIDRLSLQMFRRYSVSGAAQFGEIVVNLWTYGIDESADPGGGYVFISRVDATNDTDIENVIAASVHTGRDGVGQAFYRQQTPLMGDLLQSLEFLPTVGQFPTFAYPVNERIASDSLGEIETFGLSVLLGFPDKDGFMHSGGVARHRYYRENAQRRGLTITAHNHDWMEPGDPYIQIIDDRIDPTLSAEFWVISNRTLRYADGAIEAEMNLVTSGIVNAILRAQ
jgi:hypothetical protein